MRENAFLFINEIMVSRATFWLFGPKKVKVKFTKKVIIEKLFNKKSIIYYFWYIYF